MDEENGVTLFCAFLRPVPGWQHKMMVRLIAALSHLAAEH